MPRKKEEISILPASIWGQPIEAVVVKIIPPANQEEADQDYYDQQHYINDTDESFLRIHWQFNTGRYRVVGSNESDRPTFERLNSPEWEARIGQAMTDPQYQLSGVNRELLLSVRENLSAVTLFLLFFGKNKFRQIIREAELTKDERDFICGEILFEARSTAFKGEEAFVNNLVYSLNRGKF